MCSLCRVLLGTVETSRPSQPQSGVNSPQVRDSAEVSLIIISYVCIECTSPLITNLLGKINSYSNSYTVLLNSEIFYSHAFSIILQGLCICLRMMGDRRRDLEPTDMYHQYHQSTTMKPEALLDGYSLTYFSFPN